MHDLILLCDGADVCGGEACATGLEKNIVIKVRNRITGEECVVLEQIHDIEKVLAWFHLWADKLINEEPPKWLPEAESLANAIDAFYQTALDELDEQVWDEIYAYRTRHDLRFAFRGTDISPVLIGKWHGLYTISMPSSFNLAFQIDLPNFLSKISSSNRQHGTRQVDDGRQNGFIVGANLRSAPNEGD